MLALDIEWLMGVCYAARDPSDQTPDWPPQPDRIFSALVATWGARGCDAEERAALEWLEAQAPPLLVAASGRARTPVVSYVPVNDKHDFAQMGGRARQPRQFPAMRLADEAQHLRLVWREAQPAAHVAALQLLANDTSYVGHSASVVRCRFADDASAPVDAIAARRAPYPTRLAELERLHARHMDGDERARPRPSTRSGAAPEKQEWVSPFGRDWIVLEHAGGDRPDLRAIAPVAKAMRDALMSAYGDPLPEWLSGHKGDRSPSAEPHLAIAPLANVGFPWSDGRQHGLALILPRAQEEKWRDPRPDDWSAQRKFDAAIERLHRSEGDDGESAMELHLGAAGVWRLQRVARYEKESLRPSRYFAAPGHEGWRTWTSATPVALDRHLKKEKLEERLAEAADVIAQSVRNLAREGEPAPPAVEVRVHKHAAVQGAASAWPAGGSPRWQNWARPSSLKARQLYHATLAFEAPIRGPLLIGAGRFVGLGLFLPRGGRG